MDKEIINSRNAARAEFEKFGAAVETITINVVPKAKAYKDAVVNSTMENQGEQVDVDSILATAFLIGIKDVHDALVAEGLIPPIQP